MSTIDPFAPADSPQHPANWGSRTSRALPEDAMLPWLRLDDDFVSMDNPDASIIGMARWEEYNRLLVHEAFGTPEEIALFTQHMSGDTIDAYGAEQRVPKLSELRAKRDVAEAAKQGAIDTPPVQDRPAEPTDDLAAKLAALNEAGL